MELQQFSAIKLKLNSLIFAVQLGMPPPPES